MYVNSISIYIDLLLCIMSYEFNDITNSVKFNSSQSSSIFEISVSMSSGISSANVYLDSKCKSLNVAR